MASGLSDCSKEKFGHFEQSVNFITYWPINSPTLKPSGALKRKYTSKMVLGLPKLQTAVNHYLYESVRFENEWNLKSNFQASGARANIFPAMDSTRGRPFCQFCHLPISSGEGSEPPGLHPSNQCLGNRSPQQEGGWKELQVMCTDAIFKTYLLKATRTVNLRLRFKKNYLVIGQAKIFGTTCLTQHSFRNGRDHFW